MLTWPTTAKRFFVSPVKFGIVGVANTLLDFALFMALVYLLGMRPTPANVISYSCGILNSFILNKHWTFCKTPYRRQTDRQLIMFVVFNVVGLGIASAIVWALADHLGPAGAKLIAIVGTFTWNYLTSRYLVFAG